MLLSLVPFLVCGPPGYDTLAFQCWKPPLLILPLFPCERLTRAKLMEAFCSTFGETSEWARSDPFWQDQPETHATVDLAICTHNTPNQIFATRYLLQIKTLLACTRNRRGMVSLELHHSSGGEGGR